MTVMKVIGIDARAQHGTALVAIDDSVWVAVCPAWWDFASRLWWWLAPADRKAWVVLAVADGTHVRTRAIRISSRHVRIGRAPTT